MVAAEPSTELKPTKPDDVIEPAAQADVQNKDNAQRKRDVLDPIAHSGNQDLKAQRKRGVFGHIPSYSHGHDFSTVRHSILKPFVVNYPVQSVPIGVKIPIRNPGLIHFKYPLSSHKDHSHHGSESRFPQSIQHPNHLKPTIVPGWPANCGHNHQAQPAQRPTISVPTTAIIPTSSVNLPVNIVPAPVLTPVLPFPRPPAPFFRPLIPIQPPAFGPVPFTPVFPAPLLPTPLAPVHYHPAPVLHPAPIAAPLAPAIIRPGNSIHTSFSATYPRYPFVNSLPALNAQIPIVGHHLAPAAIAPIGRYPINVGHVPLNVGRLPLARPPVLFNQIPLGAANFPNIGNLPLNHFHTAGAGLIPTRAPLGIGQPPVFLQRPGEQFPPQFTPGPSAFPPFNQAFGGATGVVPSQAPLGTGQPPFFFQRPGEQYPQQAFSPDNPSFPQFLPGPQDQGTAINPNAIGNNVWTPMVNPTPESFPSQFNPQSEAPNNYPIPQGENSFPSQFNPQSENPNQYPSQLAPQGENPNQYPSQFIPQGQNPDQYPSQFHPQGQNPDQYPSQIFPEGQNPDQFTSQFNPQAEKPQGINPTQQPEDQTQGYRYQQEGSQAFQDGKDIQATLEQQAQQQFLNAQKFFAQEQQQIEQQQQEQQPHQQESNNQGESQQQAQQQYLQQQNFNRQQQNYQPQQDASVQQDSQEDIQQSSFQFISPQQQAAANPQHDPQFPQALPSHPLSGRPINQAFHVNHRQRQRARRPAENQEGYP